MTVTYVTPEKNQQKLKMKYAHGLVYKLNIL